MVGERRARKSVIQIASGASVRARNEEGETALSLALAHENTELAELLHDYGASD